MPAPPPFRIAPLDSGDNPPEILSNHYRSGSVDGKVDGSQVQIEHPVPGFLTGFVNLPRRESSGNANQEIQSTPAFDNVGNEMLDGAGVGQIGLGAPQLLPCRTSTTFERCPMLVGGVGHRHTRTASGKIHRHCAAQCASSARDDGNSTLKVHKSTSLPAISKEME